MKRKGDVTQQLIVTPDHVVGQPLLTVNKLVFGACLD